MKDGSVVGKRGMKELEKRMNEHAGSGMSSFGRKILEKFGWKEGKGLGKNEDGMTSHVKVKQRDDSAGLGIEEHDRAKVTENWWFNAFEQALTSVKVAVDGEETSKKAKKKKKRKLREEKESVIDGTTSQGPSFDELFKATGGRRLGMRARMSQKAKWERTEVGHVTWHKGDKEETAEVTTTMEVQVDRTVEVDDGSDEGDNKGTKGKSSRRLAEVDDDASSQSKGEKKKKKRKKRKECPSGSEERDERVEDEEEGKRKKKKSKRKAEKQEDSVDGGDSIDETGDEAKKKKKKKEKRRREEEST